MTTISADQFFTCRPVLVAYGENGAPDLYAVHNQLGEQVIGAQVSAACSAISRMWARSNQGKEALEAANLWLFAARSAAPAPSSHTVTLSDGEAKKVIAEANRLYR